MRKKHHLAKSIVQFGSSVSFVSLAAMHCSELSFLSLQGIQEVKTEVQEGKVETGEGKDMVQQVMFYQIKHRIKH